GNLAVFQLHVHLRDFSHAQVAQRPGRCFHRSAPTDIGIKVRPLVAMLLVPTECIPTILTTNSEEARRWEHRRHDSHPVVEGLFGESAQGRSAPGGLTPN